MSGMIFMTVKRAICGLTVTSLLFLFAFVVSGQQQGRLAFVSNIASVANAALRDGPIAGMSVAVMQSGTVVLVKGYGYANLENNVPATPDTVYRIRSISKMFAAVAILQLVDQGKISLDDELTKFLPDYPTHGQSVKVRYLLSHTSGVKNYGGPSWRKNKRLDLSPAEWIALVRDEPFDFSPGTNFNYSNAGYDLLAMIVAKVSGETYPDYIRKHIAEPLGLNSTGYCTNQAFIKNRAAPYEVVNGAIVNADAWGNYGFGSAMICSTVTDLVKWQAALNEHRILSAASVSLMRTATKLSGGPVVDYGFGTRMGDVDGHLVVGHSGSGGGWTSALAYYPIASLTIVVLTNTENDDDFRYIDATRLQESIARKVLGSPESQIKNLPLPSGESPLYVGNWGDQKAPFRIFEDGGGLKFKPPEYPGVGTRMLYQGAHTFVLEDDPHTRIKFFFDGQQTNWVMAYRNSFFEGLTKRLQ